MFHDRPILIVEDEAMIAMDLADAVAALDGMVLGPVASVREALEILDREPVAGAILDASLIDRDISPVALRLACSGVPLVVHSATGLPPDVAAQWPGLPVLPKPAFARTVVERLLQEIAKMERPSAG
jgi:DNA-binding response OmpR family regulator